MRTIRIAAAAALLPALAGCLATKRDVEDLRLEMQTSRQAQERQIDDMVRRVGAMLDTLETQNTRFRGDIANRLVQIERQLVQIQELSGQSQAQLNELRRQINQRAEEARRAEEAARDTARAGTGGPDTSGGADASEAQAVYDAALGAFRRNSFTTARAGFEEFLRVAPRHRLAADAQLYIGESYGTRDPDAAIEAYERVVEAYSASPRAPTALLRIGRIEAGRGNRTEARARYNQVIRAYPRSPEAEQARTELARTGTSRS
ncbi:MAG TPA: tol-pal system protein YbgF [Longimicrobium sp.]|nr:tol-pal system protein YbgF [Longimicrobium sp.]